MDRNQLFRDTITEGSLPQSILLVRTPVSERADEITSITGSGMEPMYSDGDRVFVEKCAEIAVGEIGIFEFPDAGRVIRYKTASGLHRINPECEDFVLNEQCGRVIGRVLGKITPDMLPTPEEEMQYYEAIKRFGERSSVEARGCRDDRPC